MGPDRAAASDAVPIGRGDARRQAIHAAAIEEFSTNGIRGASMARIAERAGVSRPALYQYFDNKHEIFASTFVALLEDHVERALAALAAGQSTVDQIDGFLQCFAGDLWERMAASPHADEIESAKTGEVAVRVVAVFEQAWDGLDGHLAALVPGAGAAVVKRRQGWRDLIQLGSRGLRVDHPSVEIYRERLRALAESVASDVDAVQKAAT